MNLKIRLAGLALATAVSGSAIAADPIKIGLVLPMSGPFAAYGKQIQNGVKLYLSTHGGAVGGRQVELFLKDDSPGTAGDVSKRLAQELGKIMFCVGDLTFGTTAMTVSKRDFILKEIISIIQSSLT